MRLPGSSRALNLGLAFLLEIAALVALAWWGFTAGGNVLVNTALLTMDREAHPHTTTE